MIPVDVPNMTLIHYNVEQIRHYRTMHKTTSTDTFFLNPKYQALKAAEFLRSYKEIFSNPTVNAAQMHGSDNYKYRQV